MNKKEKLYHFVLDHKNIEALQKMVNEAVGDTNIWLDAMYMPEDSSVGEPPSLSIAEMLWDKNINKAVVLAVVEYTAQLLEQEAQA